MSFLVLIHKPLLKFVLASTNKLRDIILKIETNTEPSIMTKHTIKIGAKF